jgi:hypothetical protein
MKDILCNINLVLNVVNLVVALGVVLYFATMRDITENTERPAVDATTVMKDASTLPSNKIRATFLLEDDVKKTYKTEVPGEAPMAIAAFDSEYRYSLFNTNVATKFLDRKAAIRELKSEVDEGGYDIDFNSLQSEE